MTPCLAPAVVDGKTAYHIRNISTKELLYVGSKHLDPNRRYALTWAGNAERDTAAMWMIEDVGARVEGEKGHLVRLKNVGVGEYLYCGSSMLDDSQRLVLTWTGNPNTDPAMVWSLL